MREMQSPEGGYYSSFDADSEGHEGKFYVWNREEIRQALDDADSSLSWAVFAARFGLDRPPNFEGQWHLHIFRSVEDIARDQQTDKVESLIESARRKLLAIRNARTWPARDDKILTSWNALMIRGMAIASRALGRTDLAESATAALRVVQSKLWSNGKLLATYKDGVAHLGAYLDDYVFLVDAILELQQSRFNSAELKFAGELIEVVLGHFADADAGGFFFTSDDHETLIYRSKSFADDATPAGNGVAALVFQRMGHLLAEPRYLQAAQHTLRAGWLGIEKYPHAHTTLLNALDELLNPPQIIILRGDESQITTWAKELHKLYAPRRLVLAVPATAQDLPPALAEKGFPAAARGAIAYVCQGSTCSAPLDSLSGLVSRLRAGVQG
jgi:hypothetical protein